MTDEPSNSRSSDGMPDERGGDASGAVPSHDAPREVDPCVRAENEDDDGYDPYSDRRPKSEPLFESDPWS